MTWQQFRMKQFMRSWVQTTLSLLEMVTRQIRVRQPLKPPQGPRVKLVSAHYLHISALGFHAITHSTMGLDLHNGGKVTVFARHNRSQSAPAQ